MRNIKYAIEPSKEGLPTLSVIDDAGKKLYLHSKYNPSKEAQTLKEKFMPEKFDSIIILGAGLGYHLLPLKYIKDNYANIIIIDAIKDIKSEIAKNAETGFLTNTDKIIFLTGMRHDDIEAALNKEIDLNKIKGLNVIDHPSSVRAFNEYYNEIKAIINRVISKKAGNIATQRAFGPLYLKNILKNYNGLHSLYPVSAFFNTMSEYPAIVIAAGPSIENYIADIKANQNKFFIIAVDSALNTLIQSGISPDFFVSIDPQAFIFEHVFDLKTGGAIPVFTLSSHPLMINRFKNIRGLLSLNSHPFSQIIDDIFPGKIGHIDSRAGTVAGDAIMAAKEFSFRKTGLVGFDFSFPDFKIYPRGTAYQKRFANISSRLNPVETINFNYVMKSSKGVKLENKYTRKAFIQYKESLEIFLKDLNNSILNINNTGIPIRGIQHADLKLFINNFCKLDIDKQNIINKTLAVTATTGELISYKKLTAFIKNENILEEIIKASLEKGSLKKIERLISFFSLMSGE